MSRLLHVTEGDRSQWIAVLDDDGQLWVHLPNTGRWHRNRALEHDYYIDQELTYTPVTPAEARTLIQQGVGRLDPAREDEISRYTARSFPETY